MKGLPRTYYTLLIAQFISTLGDNAFLIVAIARVLELQAGAWLIPILKVGFTLFYVVLAPVVGALADAFPKGRVMVVSNLLKILAIALMAFGLDPVWAITLAGFGAAGYAPAKYGLITELLPPKDLVKANGFFEGATVCAVILGTVVGGALVSPWVSALVAPAWMTALPVTDSAYVLSMLALIALNVAAVVLSLCILDNGARYVQHSFHPWELVQRFVKENTVLWRDTLGGLSMSVTTLLWGVGATLQLIVLRWAQETLHLPLNQAAYLQGVTAIGVIAGAAVASRMVSLERTPKLLPLGVLLGLSIPLLLLVSSVVQAVCLLVVVGAMAGFFVVPMNALLQHRGATLLTAGRSIAVQGFNENAGMLVVLCMYSLVTALDLSLGVLIFGFGVLVSFAMLMIGWRHRQILRTPIG
jgi:MFS family permease